MSSKTVDNRVVEMHFDNANFEKNANQSIDTLQKLRQALKLDNAAKGLNDVDSAADKLNFQKLITAADTITKRFSTLGIIGTEAIKRVANSVMDLSGKFTNFITGAISGGGLSRAFNLENANFQLQGLLKDTNRVQLVMNDVSKSVDGTAYGMDSAAKAASMLAASGVKASEESGNMLVALRAITGVAAMTNSEYDGVAQIFTTIAGQGRVMGDQLLQLSSRGMNAAATLADYLTKIGDGTKYTEADIREMVTKGKISFETFAAAMDDAFGEHAFKANETFNGAMSNIKSALARIGADFVSPLIVQNGKLVELFNTIRVKINDIRKMTTPVATALADSFNIAFKQVNDQIQGTTLEPIANMFKNLEVRIKNFNKTLNLSPLFTILGNLGSIVSNVAGPVVDALRFIKLAFKDVFPGSFVERLISVTDKLKELTSGLHLNAEQMKAVRGIFQGFFTVLETIAEVLGGSIVYGFKLLDKFVAPVANKILTFAGYLGNCVYRFHEWVDENNLVTKAIDNFRLAIDYIKGKISGWIDEFKELPVVQSLIKGISETFSDSLGNIKDLFFEATQKIGDFINKILDTKHISLDDVKGLLNTLKDIASRVFQELSDHFGELKQRLSFIPEAFSNMVERVKTIIEPWKDRVVDVFQNVVDFLTKNVDPGVFISAGFGFAIFTLLNKLVDWANLLPSVVGTIKGAVKSLQTGLAKIMKGVAFSKYADGILKIAEAIGILAAALTVLSFIDPERLKNAGIALGSLAGGLTAMIVVLGLLQKFGGFDDKKLNIGGLAKTMIAFSVAIIILVEALKRVQDLDEEGIQNDLLILAALVVGMVLATNKLTPMEKGMKQSSLSMIAFAIAINGLVKALQTISELNLDNAEESLITLGILVGLLDSMLLSSRGVGFGAGVSIILSVASILLAIEAVKKIGEISPVDLVKGIAVMGALGAVLDGILLFSGIANRIGGAGMGGNAGLTMVAAAVAMLLLGHSVEKLGELDTAVLENGIKAIALLGAVMDGIILVTALAGDNAAKAGVTLVAFSAACAILSGVIYILGGMEEERVNQGLAAITALGGVLSLIIASTHLAGQAKTTLIIITVAITLLAGALAMLSFLDPHGVAVAAGAMSAVMAMFALIVASTAVAKKANSTIAIVGLVVAEIGGILALLSGFNPENVLGAAEGLSITMLALSASLFIISKAGDVGGEALMSLAIMGAILLEVGVVLGILDALGIQPSMETVLALSTMILALSAALVLLEVAGLAAGAAMAGVTALALMVTELGVLMTALGALVTYFPDLELFLDKGITILVKIGEGLGEFFGGIVAGFFKEALTILPDLGTKLSQFMANCRGFIEGASHIDSSIVESVAALSAAIIMISGAELIQGIMSFMGGGIDFKKFGEQIVELGKALVKFSDIVKDVDADAVTAAANAGKLMAEVQAMLPAEGGWIQKFLGTKISLSEFGNRLKEFGKGLKAFSDEVQGIDADAVTAAANAGKLMAEVQNMLPETGGKLQQFLGEKMDMGEFGERIEEFAKAMGRASAALVENPVDSESLTSAANAGQLFANLQSSLPETGGKLQEFLGETQSLTVFGMNIVNFCKYMGEASRALEENPVNSEAVESAKTIGDLFSALENSLAKKTGTLEAFFFGENQHLDTFAKNIRILGGCIKDFSENVTGINILQIGMVIGSISSFADIEQDLVDVNAFKMESFGYALYKFGSDFNEAVKYFSKIPFATVTLTVTAVRMFINLLRDMSDVNFDVAANFTNALQTMGDVGVDNFCNAFDNANNRAYTSLAVFIQRAMDGANSKHPAFLTLIRTNFDQIVQTIDSFQSKFLASGVQLMSKLTTGYKSMVPAYVLLASTTMLDVYNGIVEYEPKYEIAGSDLMSKLMAGFKSKETAFTTQVKSMMDEALRQVTVKDSEFNTQGQALITNLSTGIKSQESYVTTGGVKPIMDSSLTIVRNYQGSFSDAGRYLVQGIANGMAGAAWIAAQAAQNVAAQADQAARNRLKIHSPSKVGEETGEYYGEGLSIGITKSSDRAATAGETLADATNQGFDNNVAILDPSIFSWDKYTEVMKSAGKLGKNLGFTIASAIDSALKNYQIIDPFIFTWDRYTDVAKDAANLGKNIGQIMADSIKESIRNTVVIDIDTLSMSPSIDPSKDATQLGWNIGYAMVNAINQIFKTSQIIDLEVFDWSTPEFQNVAAASTQIGQNIGITLEEGLHDYLNSAVLIKPELFDWDRYKETAAAIKELGDKMGTSIAGSVTLVLEEATLPTLGLFDQDEAKAVYKDSVQLGWNIGFYISNAINKMLHSVVLIDPELFDWTKYEAIAEASTQLGYNIGFALIEGLHKELSSTELIDSTVFDLNNYPKVSEAATQLGWNIGFAVANAMNQMLHSLALIDPELFYWSKYRRVLDTAEELGDKIGNAVWMSFDAVLKKMEASVNNMTGMLGEAMVQHISQGILKAQNQFYESLDRVLYNAWADSTTLKSNMNKVGAYMLQQIVVGFRNNFSKIDDVILDMVQRVQRVLYPDTSTYFGYGAMVTRSYLQGFNSYRTLIIIDVTSLVRTILDILRKADGKPAGKALGQSFVDGLKLNKSYIYDAGKELAISFNKGWKDNLDLNTTIPVKVDYQYNPVSPVVTPSSNMKYEYSNYDQFILNPDGSTTIIPLSISEAEVIAGLSRNVAKGAATTENVVNNYNYDFNQNNYSPKALSRTDIYRDTKNQFSQLKEALNKYT